MIDCTSILIGTWEHSPQWWKNLVDSMRGPPPVRPDAIIKNLLAEYLNKHGLDITWCKDYPHSEDWAGDSIAQISTTDSKLLTWLIMKWS